MHGQPIDIPYGFCHCGCGEKTPISTKTERKWGYVRGEPRRFVPGHARRRSWLTYEVRSDTGCWLWQGHTDQNGYGRLWPQGRMVLAHRWVYEQKRGPIKAGLDLDHLCRTPGCVNPDHLEPVSHATNCRRGDQARLSLSDAQAIRAAAVDGVSRAELRRRYGVSKSAIQRVLVGETWAVD